MAAVNLAATAEQAVYVDCDVEEPNGHLFFNPSGNKVTPVSISVPQVTEEQCTGCRQCVSFCRFNALAYVTQRLLVFEEICHACGGCALICPEGAITEKPREIGRVEAGMSGDVRVFTGFLNPGEAAGIPVIHQLLKMIPSGSRTFLDCPPGSACNVMESIQAADYCLMVAEPTLFGYHNLMMVHQLVRLFQKPHGILLNKCLPGENLSEMYAWEQKIPIIGRIPYERRLGALHAQGSILVQADASYRKRFSDVMECLEQEVSHETAIGSQR